MRRDRLRPWTGAGATERVLRSRLPRFGGRRRVARVAVSGEAVPEPLLVHAVRVGVHDGHVAEYLDAVAGRVGDVERVVLAPEPVPLRVRGAVDGGPPEDFDILFFEIGRPFIELRPVFHLERDVVQARLQGRRRSAPRAGRGLRPRASK